MNKRCEVIEVNLSDVTTTGELHLALSRALKFPDYYGQNWDAFWDSMTGLVEMPQQLRLYGWQTLVERLPNDARILKQCFEAMVRDYPEWAPEVEYS